MLSSQARLLRAWGVMTVGLWEPEVNVFKEDPGTSLSSRSHSIRRASGSWRDLTYHSSGVSGEQETD